MKKICILEQDELDVFISNLEFKLINGNEYEDQLLFDTFPELFEDIPEVKIEVQDDN